MAKKAPVVVLCNNLGYGRELIKQLETTALSEHCEFKAITPSMSLTGYRFSGVIDINGMMETATFRQNIMERLSSEY